ncbi:unnamed protein product [Adineta steineri]|uniref:NHL repeat containing protein n=1 Tax=Adineta steineri TaxID=433720 RepID=A0A815J6M3_9BILA|nr:unnamed protein product [Adineta steineri]
MCINDIEVKFNALLEQLKQLQQENESNETGLNYSRKQLIKISQELNNPSNMSIPQNSQPLINDILIISSKRIFVDDWGQIYVADYGNRRIMRWYEGKGELVVSGYKPDQLSGLMG